jgi:hypothetical protein
MHCATPNIPQPTLTQNPNKPLPGPHAYTVQIPTRAANVAYRQVSFLAAIILSSTSNYTHTSDPNVLMWHTVDVSPA